MSRAVRLKIGTGSLHVARAYPPADMLGQRKFLLIATEGQTRKVVERIERIVDAKLLSIGVWVLAPPYTDHVLDELDDMLPSAVFCKACKGAVFCEYVADLADVLEAARLTVACLPNARSHHVVEIGYAAGASLRVKRDDAHAAPRDERKRRTDRAEGVRTESGNDPDTYWRQYWARFQNDRLVAAALALGLSWPVGRDAIVAAHRAAVLQVHPDKGGRPEQAAKVNAARDELLRAIGTPS